MTSFAAAGSLLLFTCDASASRTAVTLDLRVDAAHVGVLGGLGRRYHDKGPGDEPEAWSGELAEAAGVNLQTLLYYERRGRTAAAKPDSRTRRTLQRVTAVPQPSHGVPGARGSEFSAQGYAHDWTGPSPTTRSPGGTCSRSLAPSLSHRQSRWWQPGVLSDANRTCKSARSRAAQERPALLAPNRRSGAVVGSRRTSVTRVRWPGVMAKGRFTVGFSSFAGASAGPAPA